MIHDPLCPFFYDHTGRELVRQTGNPCTYCKLIANVREDERDKQYEAQSENWAKGYAAGLDAAREAVVRLEPLLTATKSEGGYDCCGCLTPGYLYVDAIDAIDALKTK